MDKYKTQKDETLRLLSVLENATQMSLDLFFMRVEKSKKPESRYSVKERIRPRDAYYILKKENAWWKNDTQSKNYYFAWSRSQELDIAFVDDLQDIERFKSEGHLALIQTSEGKYQALFKLSQKVSADKLLEIQRVLKDQYNGDIGAISPWQMKRLTGFLNTKYEERPLVRLDFTGSNTINPDELLPKKTNEFKVLRPKIKRVGVGVEKSWLDFYDGDNSRTDMRYTLYLMTRGYSRDEIAKRLRDESKDLYERKLRVDDYIERTIRKAESYFRP